MPANTEPSLSPLDAGAAALQSEFSFAVGKRLSETCPPTPGQVAANGGEFLGRTGTISTPHGEIRTPAFIAVGTKATVKSVLPESIAELGAQAVLANAYHLYLQPGADILDEAGGLGAFMNWPGPTFTDSGGFQVMSLGSGFKKVIDMKSVDSSGPDDAVAPGKERLAHMDEEGVWFKSHLNGDRHRFSPEISMQVQHQIGADIMFAFDELTTLQNSRGYQEESLERTRLLGGALHHRALPADFRARGQAVPGAVRRDPGRPVRGPAPQGLPGPGRHELRRLRDRRSAGEGEPGHHRALVQRGTAGEQAAAPAGHLRTGRHLHRDRERRGHLRLRLPHPGGPQLGVLHTRTGASTCPVPSTSATSARCRRAATATPA